MEIQNCFKSIVQSVENNRVSVSYILNQKQNEMVQRSTKFSYNSNFKNEAIAIWSDANAKISACFAKINQFVNEKAISVAA